MHVSELSEVEHLGLMAALRYTISADGKLSAEEHAVIQSLAADLGVAAFEAIKARAKATLTSFEMIKPAISAVTRKEAQRVIYEYAFRAAESDGLIAEELERLLWIASEWTIAVDPSTGAPFS